MMLTISIKLTSQLTINIVKLKLDDLGLRKPRWADLLWAIHKLRLKEEVGKYRTSAIISRGLYNFYPIFHCGLYSKAANITDNLCTKQGNSSKKSTVYNKERFQIKSGL